MGLLRLSSAGSLDVAIEDRLLSDPEFTAFIGGRLYADGSLPKTPSQGHGGQVPANPPAAPHLLLGSSSESPFMTFMRAGNQNGVLLLAIGKHKQQALVIYAHLCRLLNGVKLPLTDHTMAKGEVVLTTSFADPDGRHYRAVCQYTAYAQQNDDAA